MRGQQERTGPPVLLRLHRGADSQGPSPAAGAAVGGSHPRSAQSHLLQALPRGRSSIPPEQLLLALLLQAIYGIRSERMLIEQLDSNLLFRWFVGLNPDDPAWHPT